MKPNGTLTMARNGITIHVDGCCLGNPGKGGYAAVVRRYENGVETKKRAIAKSEPETTNNQMELMAGISGLRQIKRNETAKITVFSDSQYVVLGMSERLPNWRKEGWRCASGRPVKNQELWETLWAVSIGLNVQWKWVCSQSGDLHMEEADLLAKRAASEQAR